MARVFWVAVGAAAGVWAYKRGEQALAAAKERSTLENLQVATQTATKVAATGAKVIAGAGAQGAKVAARLTPKADPAPMGSAGPPVDSSQAGTNAAGTNGVNPQEGHR